jgi:hypothetical protein
MDQNPYESPQTPAEVHSRIEHTQHNPPGCFAVGASFIVVFISPIISMLLKPLEMPKWAEGAALAGMLIGGLTAVWSLHYALVSYNRRHPGDGSWLR